MYGRGQRIYRIEGIEVDASQGCLKRDGQEQHLRQKTFQVLLYLLEQHQRVVSKEELLDHIWPETAVTDNALEQCLVDIRKILGDDSRHPRFIKTVPKVGYRFIGPVEEGCFDAPAVETRQVTTVELEYEEEDADHVQPADVTPPALPAAKSKLWGRHRLALVAALAAILIAGIALGIYLGQKAWPAKETLTEVTMPQVPGKKPIAVMYFENQSGSGDLDWLREGLADMLITDLSRSKKLTVLSRGQLHLLLERSGRRQANVIRLDEALDIARRTQAEVIVLGSFARLDDKVRIVAQLHDARSGQLITSEHLVVDEPGDILTQVDLLSLKLAAHLGAAPDGQDTSPGLTTAMTKSLEAYRYYSLALEKAQALENKEAIALLEKAIALDPEFAMAHARIGYTYAITWGLADKARPYLEKAFQLSDRLTEKDGLYIAAWYAIANLDYSGAIAGFREIIARYPLEIEAYMRLCRLLQAEEQEEEAVSVAKQGLVIDAEAKHLYNLLGGIYLQLNRHDEAIVMFQRYVQLAPDEPNARDSLGLGYQWAGRYAEAIQEYDRALALHPGFEVALIHLANACFQLGRYQEAISHYRRYIQIAPSDMEQVRGYSSLAHVYWKKGDLERSEQAAREERRYHKEAVWSSLVLALERGDLTRAERLREQLFAQSPFTTRGARPPLRAPYYHRGYLALKSRLAAEAIENFKEALRHRPLIWHLDAYEDCLANAYLELGQLDEAIAEYERVLGINPHYPLAHYHLGQAYERKGERERAHAAYERFLEIWNAADPDIPEVLAAKRQLLKYEATN